MNVINVSIIRKLSKYMGIKNMIVLSMADRNMRKKVAMLLSLKLSKNGEMTVPYDINNVYDLY